MFIDTHCHVYGEKLDGLVENARKAGVGIVVNSGANVRANRKTLKLAERFKEFRATMGLYPADALKMSDEKIDKEIEFIRSHANKIVAISEIGMDFQESEERERQEEIFRKFISLAQELDVPVVVHSRKAEKEVVEVLEDMKAKKVVMHCFSGRTKLVEKIIENGWTLTIPTNVGRSTHFQHVVGKAPIEQLLCETDSPFLHPLGGDRKNEPANVVASYEGIASLKGLKLEEVERFLEGNFKRLFGSLP
ncbi:MAG: TatD family hydrolase [archaeon]